MIREAIFHMADSAYCFAAEKKEITLRLRAAASDEISVFVLYGCKYDFTTKRKKAGMIKTMSDGLFSYYTVTLTLKDPRFVYLFEICDAGGGSWYYSEEGLSRDYDFSFWYLSVFQLPYIGGADTHHPVEWLQNAVFYQIFVDRFRRGDKNKDGSYINLSWGDIPSSKSFAGGDLAGITEKLTYIRRIGANALYLTPIFLSSSNHKYNTWDYYQVDPMFGTNGDLKKLVEKARSLGIRVVLDAVFNHCGEGFAPWRDILEKGEQSRYYSWFHMNGNEYEHFGASKYMPKLNTSDPGCADYLLGVAEHWIREYDIDGWRLDVSDEVSHTFWREFRKRVKAVKPDCALIGENWHNAEPFLRGDQFDSVMNYAFTKVCLDYFANRVINEQGLSDKLNALLARNTDIANSMMFNLLDNHDTHRFINYTNGDKKALRAALALGFVFPGSFCVYYGTENDMRGGHDPDSRRCFDWTQKPGETAALIKEMAALKKTPVMKRGAVSIRCEDGVFILERKYRGKTVTFYLKGLEWRVE